ncbi:MAG: putative manganese transporter [Bacteroidota bacterium]|nr:putative manganese transporter [Bacteroidota bacterium]
MEFNLWLFILDNLEAAGAIGGYVSLSIIGFALISFAIKIRYDKLMSQIGPRWAHPIIGAFLGAIPGCGATIVVASLYKNKKISFGGLFATFISTLGEGSFVLLGASSEADVLGNLQAYVTITIFGLLAGVVFGYFSDLLVFKFKVNFEDNQEHDVAYQNIQKPQNPFAVIFVEKLGFYAIITMAIFLAPGSIMALWGGGIDAISHLTSWVSVSLTITCIIFYFVTRVIYKYHDCYGDLVDGKSTMLHAILDVALVVTYVFIGLFFANYIIDIIIGAETFDVWMTSSAHIVILLSALIGVTPGCGGMIAVAVAFITIPNFPMAALIAASISTSGDGIFPLFAENRKEGLMVSGFGLVVALVIGYVAFALGF